MITLTVFLTTVHHSCSWGSMSGKFLLLFLGHRQVNQSMEHVFAVYFGTESQMAADLASCQKTLTIYKKGMDDVLQEFSDSDLQLTLVQTAT